MNGQQVLSVAPQFMNHQISSGSGGGMNQKQFTNNYYDTNNRQNNNKSAYPSLPSKRRAVDLQDLTYKTNGAAQQQQYPLYQKDFPIMEEHYQHNSF